MTPIRRFLTIPFCMIAVLLAVCERIRADTPDVPEELKAVIGKFNGYADVRKTEDGRAILRIQFGQSGPKDGDLEQLLPLLRKSSLPIALTLEQCQVTDAGIARLSGLDTLQSLALSEIKISDAGLKEVGKLTKLEELYVSSDKLTDAGVANLSKLTNLRKLSVFSKGVTNGAYAYVEGMTQLEEIHLGGFSNGLGDACLSHMKGLTRLKELKLDGSDLTDSGMANLKYFTQAGKVWLEAPKVTTAGAVNLGALKNLEELTVLSCPGLDDDGLHGLTGLKKLRVLDLVNIEAVTSKGSSALAGLTGLRKLRIGGVGENGLQGLAELHDLESLDLNFSHVGDDNLAPLSGLAKLRVLNLQDTSVTDAGMKRLGDLTGLRELWLSDDKITDEGLKSLAKLSQIEKLYIGDCKITGTAFKDLRAMTGLKELWLGGNPVTSANALALKDLKGLTRVELTGTTVSEEAALELKQARPDLGVWDVTGNEVSLDAKAPASHRTPMEDLSRSAPDFSLTADAFHKEFKDGEADAKKKYQGKVIELTGEVSNIGRNFSGDTYISLKADGDLLGVMCFTTDDQPWAKAAPGQKVKLKGKPGEFGTTLISCAFTDAGKFEVPCLTAADLAKEFAANPEAAAKKYNEKYLIVSGEIEKKEYNSAGAVAVFLTTTGSNVHVSLSFTAFEKDMTRSIKPGQKIKAIGQYTLNFGTDKVELYFCMPIK